MLTEAWIAKTWHNRAMQDGKMVKISTANLAGLVRVTHIQTQGIECCLAAGNAPLASGRCGRSRRWMEEPGFDFAISRSGRCNACLFFISCPGRLICTQIHQALGRTIVPWTLLPSPVADTASPNALRITHAHNGLLRHYMRKATKKKRGSNPVFCRCHLTEACFSA